MLHYGKPFKIFRRYQIKKIIIYYFSGTGNTWWIATTLQSQLKDHAVDCYSIETLAIEDLTNQAALADHIILGFPVYGSTAIDLQLKLTTDSRGKLTT